MNIQKYICQNIQSRLQSNFKDTVTVVGGSPSKNIKFLTYEVRRSPSKGGVSEADFFQTNV